MTAGRARPSLRQAADAAVDAYVRAPALQGVRTPVTQRRGLLARMRALEEHGGEKAAAAAAGVTPRTWRGWRAGTRPTARSLAGLQGAYDRDLDRRGQTPARRKAEARRLAAAGTTVELNVKAEFQWDGYYNGQSTTGPSGPADEEFPPEPGNRQAWRTAGVSIASADIGPLLRAWSAGRNTGAALEQIYQVEYSRGADPSVFLNTYYRGAEVTIR